MASLKGSLASVRGEIAKVKAGLRLAPGSAAARAQYEGASPQQLRAELGRLLELRHTEHLLHRHILEREQRANVVPRVSFPAFPTLAAIPE